MNQDLKIACETLGIDITHLDSFQIKDVISIYRNKTRKVHPDKFNQATEEEKRRKTEEFQKLNNGYETILKYIVENGNTNTSSEQNEDDEEAFMKNNFNNFNFPKENTGSFTVIIQHSDADTWHKCLVDIYGNPVITRNDRGTVLDTFWKFPFEDEGRKIELTLHIYNKPKTKKESKLLIQGGFQPLTCLYVFTELPKIYKKVSKEKPKAINDMRTSPKLIKPTVKCEQCKFKAPLIAMKKHIRAVHGPKPQRASKRICNFTPISNLQKRRKSAESVQIDTKKSSEGILEESIFSINESYTGKCPSKEIKSLNNPPFISSIHEENTFEVVTL